MHNNSRLVAISFVLPLLIEEAIKASIHAGPSKAQNITVCLIASAWLFWLAFRGKPKSETVRSFHHSLIFLACGYLFIAILYFLPTLNITVANGYDSITELLGSVLFIGAAASLLRARSTDNEREVDLAILICLSILILLACIGKAIFDFHLNPSATVEDASAARLLVNICNGGIVLILYSQLRRISGGVHPLIHVSIVFFAIAEIVAQGSSCQTSTREPCRAESMAAIVALGIAWSLLVGKVVFVSFVTDTFVAVRDQAAQSIADSGR